MNTQLGPQGFAGNIWVQFVLLAIVVVALLAATYIW